ncbi:hypothetical protein HN51_059479 [Arachis hypogaea]|uniref:Uncharacterized protein n=1 Tax=Arachis hypogaea TaxID=3818 RepID=A0A444X5T0_ARAHY|nr:uncharacterized protein LOC107621837 [Arachis ipaensis]XP_025685378.1 uncharacterized protein LOC112786189 [Arachis hypogaea]QHN82891.1 uncharacterized protein DS421_20g699760 [Arachis hypogaea]RYQ85028.1 hypothetical protein Ahy_B10g104513 [Arachis hypogaea]
MAEDASKIEEACALDSVEGCECDNEDTSTVTYYCDWFHGHGLLCSTLKELKKELKGLKRGIVLRGQKWKTHFVPWLRTCCCSFGEMMSKKKKKKRRRRMQFQYDPKSYALNFDDGMIENEDDGAYLDFSARYACPLGINKEFLGLEASLNHDDEKHSGFIIHMF